MPRQKRKAPRKITHPSPCPVLDDQALIVSLSADLARTLRKLNRDLQACTACPGVIDCPLRTHLNTIINAAIDQVTDEWNLVPRLPLSNPPTLDPPTL